MKDLELNFDDCLVTFISEEQKQRFIKKHTRIVRGKRIMIHGFDVQLFRGKMIYRGEKLEDFEYFTKKTKEK